MREEIENYDVPKINEARNSATKQTPKWNKKLSASDFRFHKCESPAQLINEIDYEILLDTPFEEE